MVELLALADAGLETAALGELTGVVATGVDTEVGALLGGAVTGLEALACVPVAVIVEPLAGSAIVPAPEALFSVGAAMKPDSEPEPTGLSTVAAPAIARVGLDSLFDATG